ncbi:MAG: hypothetical protein LBS82_05900 [Spirochaetaceae bacterium]|nr:hypothetical protein [Spirochaetaceae bacterium]
MNKEIMLISCLDCGADGCALFCAEGAIAFFHGNVMVEAAKCAACGSWKGAATIPACISGCARGGGKTIIEVECVDNKRGRAVEALSLL